MEDYDEKALQDAAATGIAKAKAQFDAIAKEMAGRPADDVHAELVKRLEAKPFEWDDEGLRRIAASISEATSESEDSSAQADTDEATDDARDDDDEPAATPDEPTDGDTKAE
jgi:hypothetical protein